MNDKREVAQGVVVTPPPPIAVMEVSPKAVELSSRDTEVDKFIRHGARTSPGQPS